MRILLIFNGAYVFASLVTALLLKIQILKYTSILRFGFITRLEFELYSSNSRLYGQTLISIPNYNNSLRFCNIHLFKDLQAIR